ncbi:hypothetical protein DND62_26410 [Pseudomonas syringae pv. pisi]|nr:hypothetical protein DND62_26410 [Pseudomonas syringae pv. pisi]
MTLGEISDIELIERFRSAMPHVPIVAAYVFHYAMIQLSLRDVYTMQDKLSMPSSTHAKGRGH